MVNLTDKHIHLISFDIPFPPDYGGIIDVFYKIKALSDAGVKVHLHCFEYGRKKSGDLESLCYEVNYYKRERGLKYFFRFNPYIVSTRLDQDLLNNLIRYEYPVIYEGLHTSIYSGCKELRNRRQVIRMHNIEHRYYKSLSSSSRNIKDKIFHILESKKLRYYINRLDKNLMLACISESDAEYFQTGHEHKFRIVKHIPPFHENTRILSRPGRGRYILYHGNLSVSENEKAVLFILNSITQRIRVPVVIAGKNPTKKLVEALKKHSHVKLIANPGAGEMEDLIVNAHINLLPSGNSEGFKLKLINSLFKGRFCLISGSQYAGTGIGEFCQMAFNTDDFIDKIERLFSIEFSNNEIIKREKLLSDQFSNSRSASLLLDMLLS